MQKTISKGYKKFIREEKARIRREVLDPTEQEKQIAELYKNVDTLETNEQS